MKINIRCLGKISYYFVFCILYFVFCILLFNLRLVAAIDPNKVNLLSVELQNKINKECNQDCSIFELVGGSFHKIYRNYSNAYCSKSIQGNPCSYNEKCTYLIVTFVYLDPMKKNIEKSVSFFLDYTVLLYENDFKINSIVNPGIRLKKFIIEEANFVGIKNLTPIFAYCDCEQIIIRKLKADKELTDVSSLFSKCKNLKKIEINEFEIGDFKNLSNMFKGCTNLEEIDLGISLLKEGTRTNMDDMFEGCDNIKKIKIDKNFIFDTKKKIFGNLKNLKTLDISECNFQMDYEGWDLTNLITNIVKGGNFTSYNVVSPKNDEKSCILDYCLNIIAPDSNVEYIKKIIEEENADFKIFMNGKEEKKEEDKKEEDKKEEDKKEEDKKEEDKKEEDKKEETLPIKPTGTKCCQKCPCNQ